jgi:hypothetical protein
MSDYHSRPDGEVFVDKQTKPMPPADTWPSLSTNQLLEIQVLLQQRAWEFRANQAMATQLNAAVARLQALISSKLIDG